jgi:hypothetical protein
MIARRSCIQQGGIMSAKTDRELALEAADDAFSNAVQNLVRVLHQELTANPANAVTRFEAGLKHASQTRIAATKSIGGVLS